MPIKALLFSGYNQRAIIALCRYFRMVEIEFAIVSSGPLDVIYKTEYKKHVILERTDNILNLELFKNIGALKKGNEIVYCPTSEYLNYFMLTNRIHIEKYDIKVGLPSTKSYNVVSNKLDSQKLLNDCNSISIIESMNLSRIQFPCVAKPISNIFSEKILYPLFCATKSEFKQIFNKIDTNTYFLQPHITGQSYYICGYLSKRGKYNFFWQENLLQQPGGKSIIFAHSSANPGLDEKAFFERIHQAGYYGPIMAEFIKKSEKLFFIEINPRFWGPLQLMIDCKPSILNLYLDDWFQDTRERIYKVKHKSKVYYSWFKGSSRNDLQYPAFIEPNNLTTILKKYDVYNRLDTKKIHMLS